MEKSHFKILENLNINITNLTDFNILNTFDKIKNEKPKLSDNYKISILNTIKKHNSNVTASYSKLGLKQFKKNYKISPKLVKDVNKVTLDIISQCENNKFEGRTPQELYMFMAVLLVLCFRIKNTNHVTSITLNNSSYIYKSKKFNLIKVEPYYTTLHQYLLNLNKYVQNNYIELGTNISNYYINVKIDAINKSIRNFYSKVIMDEPSSSLGLSKFKYVDSNIFQSVQNSVLQNLLYIQSVMENDKILANSTNFKEYINSVLSEAVQSLEYNENVKEIYNKIKS